MMTLYIDGVDWQHELGAAADGTRFFPSLEAIKEYSPCWVECGVVVVDVFFDHPRWVIPQDFSKIREKKS